MELIREIIYPTENNYTLRLPDEMIGKEVEIIAFEIGKTITFSSINKTDELKESLSD